MTIYQMPKKRVRETRMKQGQCLWCGEVGHFTATYPGVPPPPARKEVEKKHLDTPLRKSTAKPKFQRMLQVNIPEGSTEPSSEDDEELVGKGQDLL
ncbi:UNVERIFIED_CONTAM: hypothetical protein K2H54_058670 [Gekko kuhli]